MASPKYKVYDKVWVLWGRNAKEVHVLSVLETCDFSKQGTESFYHLADTWIGYLTPTRKEMKWREQDMFNTKAELLASL